MPAEDALSHIRHVRAVRACTVGFPRLLHRIVHDADHEGDPTDIVSAVTIWNAALSVHTRKVLSERGWHPLT
jgi:hypothetical protein